MVWRGHPLAAQRGNVPKKRFQGAGCALAALVGVLALLATALCGYLWWGDPRDYDRFSLVSYGDGSLATVLAHYQVGMPNRATGLRFHDEEDLVGSSGTLYLRFETPAGDLPAFLRGAHMGTDLNRGTPSDWQVAPDFTGPAARGYGWRFDQSGRSWLWAAVDVSPSLQLSIVVDPHGPTDTVYVVGQHM